MKEHIRYIGVVNCYLGCPVHESSSYNRLERFEYITDIAEFCLKHLNEYEIIDVLDLLDENVISVEYQLSHHSVIGFKILLDDNYEFVRTIDDSHGKLILKYS